MTDHGTQDVVERLRAWAAHPEYRNDGAKLCQEAAAELVRLRERVAQLEKRLEIDVVYIPQKNGQDFVPEVVPPEKRDEMPDGIYTRDCTIELQDKELDRLRERCAELENRRRSSEYALEHLAIAAEDRAERYRKALEEPGREHVIAVARSIGASAGDANHILRAKKAIAALRASMDGEMPAIPSARAALQETTGG